MIWNRFYAMFTRQFCLRVERKKSGNDVVRVLLEGEETQAFDYRFIYQSILLVLLRLVHWCLGEVVAPRRLGFTFDEGGMDFDDGADVCVRSIIDIF